jgi:hypothetical protein
MSFLPRVPVPISLIKEVNICEDDVQPKRGGGVRKCSENREILFSDADVGPV